MAEPYPKLVQLVEAFDRDRRPPDVLYLGDSVVERVSRNDRDRRALGDMVVDELAPRWDGVAVSHSGFHPAVFRTIADVLGVCRHRPRLVVLAINIRCFSPQWDVHPEYQYAEEIAALRRYADDPARPLASLEKRPIPDAEQARYAATPARYPCSRNSSIGDFLRVIRRHAPGRFERARRLRTIFVFHYMHPLTPNHPKLRLLSDTIAALKALGTRVVCYITPINYVPGVRDIGEEFLSVLRANALRVRITLLGDQLMHGPAAARAEGPDAVIDWTTRHTPRDFFHVNEPTEHLNEHGRHSLSAEIALVADRALDVSA